jgi:hypothetical protein
MTDAYGDVYYLSYSYDSSYGVYTSYDYTNSDTHYSYFYASGAGASSLSYSMYDSYYGDTYYLSYSYDSSYGVYASYDYTNSDTHYSYFYDIGSKSLSYSMYDSYTGDTYYLSYSYDSSYGIYTSYDYTNSYTNYSYVYLKAEEPKVEVLAQESNKTFESDSHQNLLVASLITMVVLTAGFIMMKCKRTTEKNSQIMEPLNDSITV